MRNMHNYPYICINNVIDALLHPFADFVDLDEEVPPSVDSDDGPGPRTQEEQPDCTGLDLAQDAWIPPLRAIGLMKAVQLAGGDHYIQAALDANKKFWN